MRYLPIYHSAYTFPIFVSIYYSNMRLSRRISFSAKVYNEEKNMFEEREIYGL